MKVALIITTYNRPELLIKCLQSLSNLSKWPEYIIFVDDHSTETAVYYEVSSFAMQHDRESYIASNFKDHTNGIKNSLLIGFDRSFSYNYDLAINLDPDTIVKPDFISRIVDLKMRFPDRIISGFNCNHPKNPVLLDGPDYVERKHANGINMCMNKHDYETIVRPALLKEGNWDFNSTNNKNFIITKPSVVDHLGWNCSTMNHGGPQGGDRACDF